jgi:hypothetical protein
MARYHRFVTIVFAAGLLVVAGGIQSARALDAKGMFAVHGVGALSCGDVTSALLKGDVSIRPTVLSWLMGYLSAMNRIQPGTYDVTPVQVPDALINMVVGVCQKDASARVETVAYSVFHAMASAGLSAASPEMQVTANGQTTTLRKDTLVAVEKYLIAEKFLHGDADGSFGATTQAALVDFQKKQNLPQTGLPDPATIVRALVEIPAHAPAPAPAQAKAPPKK